MHLVPEYACWGIEPCTYSECTLDAHQYIRLISEGGNPPDSSIALRSPQSGCQDPSVNSKAVLVLVGIIVHAQYYAVR